jgi:hypothetical protein
MSVDERGEERAIRREAVGRPMTAGRAMSRVPLLAAAVLALLTGALAGLARLGWAIPGPLGPAIAAHGALLVGGFLGTLIGLERALALGGRWPVAAPLLAGLGGLALAIGAPSPAGPLLLTLASAALVVINIAIIRRQVADYTVTMGIGAGAWLAGNLLWLAGWSTPRVVLWWVAFLVLTIAGERLDLSRLRRRPPGAGVAFAVSAGLLLAGLGLALAQPDAGARLAGLGLLALALWLARFDIAGRTVRQRGLTRYIALCLLVGYAWLAIGGLLALALGLPPAGPVYDAALHSLFLGYVISMLFGHAPVIIPIVLGRAVAFRPTFYAPLALLHLSLLLRVAADLAGWAAGRQWGGLLNVAAILLFALHLAASARAPLGAGGQRAPVVAPSRPSQ